MEGNVYLERCLHLYDQLLPNLSFKCIIFSVPVLVNLFRGFKFNHISSFP